MTKGVRPEGCAHSLRPVLVSMEELLPFPLQEVMDGVLGDAILEVGIDPAEGKLCCCTSFAA